MNAELLKDKILNSINQQDYLKALEYYLTYENSGYFYDDSLAILAGSIFHYFGERENEWDAIRKGLECNPTNYELYVMLGNYYLEQNLKQAYLCYENALFYCDKEEDKEVIVSLIEQLISEYKVSVPRSSIVILSYNLLDYTRQCIESIRSTTPESARDIVVIDNASQDGSIEWLRKQSDILLIENSKNVGFPAGCNQGIKASAPDSDIFLLNNDTIVTPNSLFWLRMGLYENDTVGSTGCVSNYVANSQQIDRNWSSVEEILAFADSNNVPMAYPYEEKLCLVGFALLIKRTVVNEIGLLDEIFTPGNCEDVDYGLRVLKAGYHNILCKNSFILHFGSKSFRKDDKKYFNLLEQNISKLNSKWNLELEHYLHTDSELIELIRENREQPLQILEIGCGCGANMAKLKSLFPYSILHGIESVPEATAISGTFGDVICTDIEQLDFPYPEDYFDYCILGNIVERLQDPQKVLTGLHKHLKKGGHIVLSVSNIKHWSVLLPLLQQDQFSYSDDGILNKAHIKMYTLREILKLLILSGYEVENYTYTTSEEPSPKEQEIINALVTYMDNPNITTFMASKYIILAKAK